MLWKILSGLAAIALVAGVWFSLQLKDALKTEKDQATRAKANLDQTKEKLTLGADKKAFWEQEYAKLEKQRDEINATLAKAKSDTELKTAEVDVIKKQLEEVNKQVAALEKQIKDAGDLQRLLANVEELKKQETAALAAVANEKQKLALAEERVQNVNADITRLEEVANRPRSGTVEPDFTARISQPFQSFGFVILNKGNLGGMFANALLDVKRGNRVVAKLKVRDVEQAMSVADLVPGTLNQGESIRSGDLVVASKVPPAPPAPAPAPAAPATAPGAAPAPGAPPSTDPFGAPAGMAPPTPGAPAPAPAASDPFGAPPAGGMAPAPAAPAAPAPAGADPFAPVPPAGAATPPAAPATPPAAPATPPAAPATPPAAPAPGTTPDPFAPPAPAGATPPAPK